ncbi:MAG: periplasmic heavy metal sensor [bacterium]
MTRRISAIFIAALIAAGVAATASAQMPGAPGGMKKGQNNIKGMKKQQCAEANTGMDLARLIRRPNLAKDLGITPEQGKEMLGKLDAARAELEEAMDTTCEASEKLKNAAFAENPDRNEIYRLIDDLTFARQDLMKIQSDLMFEILKTLTPAQWTALREMAAEAQKPKGKNK